MKISKYILGLSLVATLLFASCSDFWMSILEIHKLRILFIRQKVRLIRL